MERKYSSKDTGQSPAHNFFVKPADDGGLLQGYSLDNLGRRTTRFCVNIKKEICDERLVEIFVESGMEILFKRNNEMFVQAPRDVKFAVAVYVFKSDMDYPDRVMVDIRRSRGDGLEFMRTYLSLKPFFKDIICEEGTKWLKHVGLSS